MNDILTKIKENWIIVAVIAIVWFMFGGKKRATRRRRVMSYGRRAMRRGRRMMRRRR